MKNKNIVWVAAQTALVCVLFIQSAGFAYSQNSRPRYSHSQASQGNDQIAVDTVISLRMNTYLSSKTAHVGDKFTATVSVPVYVDGKEAIPAGTTIEGRVTQVTPAKRMNKSGMIAIDFDSITLPNGLNTQIVGVLTSDDPEAQKRIDDENQVSGGKGKDATVFVGGSGILGAILGGVSGGGKGAAVGGAVGAGIGLGTVLLSKGEEATVPTGTEFGLRLKQPLPIPDEANTYDPAQDNGGGQRNSANPQDSSAQARAQASQDTGRDIESNSRPAARYPQSGDRDTGANTNPSRDVQAEPSSEPEPQPVDENLPLSSPEMIRRAQKVLNEEGYYEGEADGVMTPRFQGALKTYQREHSLPESSVLDVETAKSLRIIGAGRPREVGRNTRNAPASQQNSERVYSDKTASQVTVDNPPVSAASRPSNRQQPVEDSPSQSVPTAGNSNATATTLQRQAADLLAEYQKLIGVRLTGTGIEMEGKQTSDDEISLLYALDSFANATQLYSRLVPSLHSQQSIRGATLSMAREARKTDRVLSTSTTRWINTLNPKWDAIRQEVLKLMYSYNINTSELDN